MGNLFSALLRTGLFLLPGIFPFAFLFFLAACRFPSWMAVSDPLPARLDAIFTYSGEGVRNLYSRSLADRYPASVWAVGDYPLLRRKNYAAGVDGGRLVFLSKRWGNTHQENQGLFAALDSVFRDRRDTIHVGLVTGPYHIRRAFLDVSFSPHPANWRFHRLPVPYEYYKWDEKYFREWYLHPRLRQLMMFETGKTIYYYFRYWRQVAAPAARVPTSPPCNMKPPSPQGEGGVF